jgi:hypothetical protein
MQSKNPGQVRDPVAGVLRFAMFEGVSFPLACVYRLACFWHCKQNRPGMEEPGRSCVGTSSTLASLIDRPAIAHYEV